MRRTTAIILIGLVAMGAAIRRVPAAAGALECVVTYTPMLTTINSSQAQRRAHDPSYGTDQSTLYLQTVAVDDDLDGRADWTIDCLKADGNPCARENDGLVEVRGEQGREDVPVLIFDLPRVDAREGHAPARFRALTLTPDRKGKRRPLDIVFLPVFRADPGSDGARTLSGVRIKMAHVKKMRFDTTTMRFRQTRTPLKETYSDEWRRTFSAVSDVQLRWEAGQSVTTYLPANTDGIGQISMACRIAEGTFSEPPKNHDKGAER